MSLGSLTSRIILNKDYCTNLDPTITGHIAVIYNYSSANTSGTLFGPLQIVLQLHGRAKTKIFEQSMYNHTPQRGRAGLVSSSHCIHDSAVQANGREELIFPFSVVLPDKVKGLQHPVLPAPYERNIHFANEDGHHLPPTMEVQCKDDASPYSGWPPFESFVEYWVSASVEMKGIDVRAQEVKDAKFRYAILSLAEEQTQGRGQGSVQSCQEVAMVRSRRLLPESAQQHGLRQKAKAMISGERQATPSLSFLVNISTPIRIWTGSWFDIAVSLAPYNVQRIDQKHHDPALEPPEIVLQSLSIYLLSTTRVRAEKEVLTEHTSEVERKEQLIVQKSWREGGLALSLDGKLPARTTSRVVKNDLIPSFKTWNISRQYVFDVTCRFSIAGELVEVKKTMDVEVCAAQQGSSDGFAPEYEAVDTSVERESVPDDFERKEAPPPYAG